MPRLNSFSKQAGKIGGAAGPLDAALKIPAAQLPVVKTSVANDVARFLLTTGDVVAGSLVFVTATGNYYLVVDAASLTTETGYCALGPAGPAIVRVRQGTTSELLTVILESGELGYATDTKRAYIGDGVTAGGNLVSGSSTASVVSIQNPPGMLRFVSTATANFNIFVRHNGLSGATGICYSKNYGTPVYAAVAANTQLTIAIPHSNGGPFLIHVYPASSATSAVLGGLTVFTASSCSLTSLSVAGLTTLTSISVSTNRLTSLDFSGLTALTSVTYSFNPFLTQVRYGTHPVLTSINAGSGAGLFEFTGLTALTSLILEGAATSVLFANMQLLTTLVISNAPALTRVDVSNFPELTTLTIEDSILVTSFTISNLPKMVTLNVLRNHALTSITVADFPLLSTVTITAINGGAVALTSVSLINLPSVTNLNVANNKLTSLSLSGVPALVTLNCSNNLITVLDHTPCPNLLNIQVATNRLSTFVLSSKFSTLGTLSLSNNLLTSVTATGYNGASAWGSYGGLSLNNNLMTTDAVWNMLNQISTAVPTGSGISVAFNPCDNQINPPALVISGIRTQANVVSLLSAKGYALNLRFGFI